MLLSERDLLERYNEYLDETYGDVSIAGLEYSASYALKQVDLTAYDVGFADWVDSEVNNGVLFEKDGEYFDDEIDLEEGA